MAKTIPQLTDATTVNAADELIIQQGGITKRATGAELAKGLNAINGTVNVKDFGAVGDGVADDTAAIQAALNSGASTVVFGPSQTYRLAANGPTVKSNTSLVGNDSILLQPNADATATVSAGSEYCALRIDCGSTNISIKGFEIRGPYFSTTATTAYRSIGINVSGRYDQYFYNNSNYPSNPSVAVTGTSTNITVEGCMISGFGQSGIVADQIVGFSASGNIITKCGRDGIRAYGVSKGNITNNRIDDMGPGFSSEGISPNNNVYGVTLTRVYHSTAGDGTLTDYPPCRDIIVAENIVSNCGRWKALDVHGATDVVFKSNVVRNAHIGIGIDKGGYDLADGYAPPRRISIQGNVFNADPSNTFGNRAGIFCVAHDATADNIGEDLLVSDNYITGYGEDTKDGNIVISNYRRGSISNNIIVGGLRCGVSLQNTIQHFAFNGGVISNVQKTSLSFLAGIAVQGGSQQVSINNVTFVKNDTADTMNAVSTVAPSAGFGVTLGNTCTFIGTVVKSPNPGHLDGTSGFITKASAFGNINNSGTATIVASRGIASVDRVSAGQVEITLSEALSGTTTIVPMAIAKSGAVICHCTVSSTSVIVVHTRDYATNAGVDSGFYFNISGF